MCFTLNPSGLLIPNNYSTINWQVIHAIIASHLASSRICACSEHLACRAFGASKPDHRFNTIPSTAHKGSRFNTYVPNMAGSFLPKSRSAHNRSHSSNRLVTN
jgi:hypothetical protein